MARSLRNLDLQKDAKDRLERQLNKCICFSVLEKADEQIHMLNTIWQQKHRWWWHVLRNEVLLPDILQSQLKQFKVHI